MSAPSSSCYPNSAQGRYDSDVDNGTWELIAPLLAQSPGRGRQRVHPNRVIFEAILYVLRGGIQWRLLPPTFPRWQTVYSRFRRWADGGVWETLTTTLRQEIWSVLSPMPRASSFAWSTLTWISRVKPPATVTEPTPGSASSSFLSRSVATFWSWSSGWDCWAGAAAG